ncbi:MAG: iron-containing alcohol dehydrogenase [Planctomycetota bacterium]|nr:iron-containing alcohol dehydrogenase [Planctomycetota bacterium]
MTLPSAHPLEPYVFRAPTRLIIGPSTLSRLGELAREFRATRALVVSDPGVVKAGHAAAGISALEGVGVACTLFDCFGENPTTEHADAGAAVALAVQPDLIVAIGGGSSLDCAKGINFLHSFGGRMQDYWGRNKAPADRGPMLPAIAVPTTAGTGSETQSFALITDATTHVKMACGDTRAAFRVAILDVDLTLTQPARVAALTAIDAISHALESHVCRTATPVSRIFSRESWRLLAANVPRVFAAPGDREARAAVQLGAAWAGLAIEHAMLGAAHACANPLTADHGVVHGQAVGLMLPHVVRFNAAAGQAGYAELVRVFLPTLDDAAAGSWLADWLVSVLEDGGLATSLSGIGISPPDVPRLAAAAALQWTAGFNPRPVTAADMAALYEAAR